MFRARDETRVYTKRFLSCRISFHKSSRPTSVYLYYYVVTILSLALWSYAAGKLILKHKSCFFWFDNYREWLSISFFFSNHKAVCTSKLMIIQPHDWSLIFSSRCSIILIEIAYGWSWPFSSLLWFHQDKTMIIDFLLMGNPLWSNRVTFC